MYLMKVPSRSRPTAARMTPGQQGREDQAVDAVLRDGRRHQHDERAGRPADLEAAAAERRDEEAADDRRVETAVGVTPEAMAIAIDSGKATMATVRPAIASALRSASP